MDFASPVAHCFLRIDYSTRARSLMTAICMVAKEGVVFKKYPGILQVSYLSSATYSLCRSKPRYVSEVLFK